MREQRARLLGLDFCYVTADSVGMPRDVAVSSLIRLGQDIVPAVATPVNRRSAGHRGPYRATRILPEPALEPSGQRISEPGNHRVRP